jgi:hypothetical protein
MRRSIFYTGRPSRVKRFIRAGGSASDYLRLRGSVGEGRPAFKASTAQGDLIPNEDQSPRVSVATAHAGVPRIVRTPGSTQRRSIHGLVPARSFGDLMGGVTPKRANAGAARRRIIAGAHCADAPACRSSRPARRHSGSPRRFAGDRRSSQAECARPRRTFPDE